MKIQIWSDIACPFCYIAKQNLEQALNQLPNKDQVSIEIKVLNLIRQLLCMMGKAIWKNWDLSLAGWNKLDIS